MCKYCEGKYVDKEPLMYKNNSDYAIKINSCNYLEVDIKKVYMG